MTRTSQQMRERAQRQLDGMTVNREEMARDVIFLCDALDAAKVHIKNLSTKVAGEGFTSAFDDIFKR